MTRLPIPGSDSGSWGDILNDFLRVEHNDDGTLKTSYIQLSQKGQPSGVAELDAGGKTPSLQLGAGTPDSTTFLRGDQSWQLLDKSTVGLANVDNTSDINKPISTATQAALDLKASSTDLNNKVNKAGDTMSGQLNVALSSSSALTVGDGTNTFAGISFQSNRTYVGYDAVGYATLQGGTSKGIRLNVNHATFGSGTVANFDSTGLFTLSTSGLTAGSGSQTAMTISPTVNQSGTAAYTMLFINPSITATGSGTNYLIDAQTGSSPRFQVSASVGATNQVLVTAPNGGGDVALSVQNNATTANETASINFYTTTNLTTPFGRVRVSRVDGANSRMSAGPVTASTVTNHIQMYGDTGYMSLGAGSVPANGLVTIGTNTTAATGGVWFGTDTNLYRSGASILKTDDAFESASSIRGVNRFYLTNSGSNFPGLEAFADTDSGFVYHYFYRKRTTGGTTLVNDTLGAFGFRGHDGTGYINGDGARIQASAAENFTSTTYSAHIDIINNNVGTASAVTTWRFAAGGILQSRVTGATGGITFGSGATQDVNLYRNAADVLKTDDAFDAASFRVGGAVGASGSFTTVDGKTVTVTNGLITSIV